MATFEEQIDMLEHALTRVSQTQEQGQARLEQALKRVEGLTTAAGEAVAGAMQASAEEAAKAHLAALMRVIDEVATASKGTVVEASNAIQELRGSIQAEAQASQRMVATEQKVEAALAALLPKATAVREGLEKELGDVVKATAATEESIKGMVANMRASITKEIETEVRGKLREAADHAAERVYGLQEWWERFTRIGIPAILALFVVVSGGLGWWFGKHQLEEGIYEKQYQALKANAQVIVYAHKFFPGPDKEVKHDLKTIDAPLVWLGNGNLALMTRNSEGQWVHGEVVVAPGKLALAEAYDSSRDNKNNTIKETMP